MPSASAYAWPPQCAAHAAVCCLKQWQLLRLATAPVLELAHTSAFQPTPAHGLPCCSLPMPDWQSATFHFLYSVCYSFHDHAQLLATDGDTDKGVGDKKDSFVGMPKRVRCYLQHFVGLKISGNENHLLRGGKNHFSVHSKDALQGAHHFAWAFATCHISAPHPQAQQQGYVWVQDGVTPFTSRFLFKEAGMNFFKACHHCSMAAFPPQLLRWPGVVSTRFARSWSCVARGGHYSMPEQHPPTHPPPT